MVTVFECECNPFNLCSCKIRNNYLSLPIHQDLSSEQTKTIADALINQV